MTASFGTPSPLPGQPGFRSSPSEVMARETAEMAERLARLKNDLAIEASLRDDEVEKAGGARWRSARTDRGSVRAYAKDVKDRYQQQICKRSQGILVGRGASGHGKPQAGTGARAAAALREEQRILRQQLKGEDFINDFDSGMRSRHIAGGFANKHVGQWSLWDTVDWLDSLGLEQYGNVFRANEISGTILLEVGADDLDYMNVRILAHRKLILKGIDELRRLSRDGFDIPPPVPSEQQSSAEESVVRRSCTDREQTQAPFAERAQDDSQQSKQRHSRTLRCHQGSLPKSSPKIDAVAHDGGQTPPANLTNDECDYRMSHDGSAIYILPNRECKMATHQPPQQGSSSTPDLLTYSSKDMQVIPIERSDYAKQEGRGTGRTQSLMLGVKGPSECWTNPFDKSPSDTSGTENATTGCLRPDEAKISTQNGFPTLDEEAEHEAFRRAVADWNRGRSGSSSGTKHSQASQSRSVDGDEPSEKVRRVQILREPEGSVPASARQRATELQVEALRKQMDSEHRKQSKLLDQTRKTLLQGLETRSTDYGQIFTAANESNRSESTGCSEHGFGTGLEDNDLLERETGESDETTSIASRSDNADVDGGTSAVEIEIVKSVLGTRECTDGGKSTYVVERDTSSEEG